MIITRKDYDAILSAKNQKLKQVSLYLDLGTLETEVALQETFAVIEGYKIPFDLNIKENFCYNIDAGKLKPVSIFSDKTNIYYKLVPTEDWPTVTLSSCPMHKITLSTPKKDTECKIKPLNPRGIVLDTCFGLGYTSILASLRADKVYAFEKDENILEIAKINPFSRPAFENSKIVVSKGDISHGIKQFKNSFFHCVIHDPPTLKLAPELYQNEFYNEIYRVLKENGKLYHYVPMPGISKGKDFSKVIEYKLKEAGFHKLIFNSDAQGFYCVKIATVA